MNQNTATQITGWAFIGAAVLYWFGWMLLPVKIGTFFVTADFASVQEQFRFWIWMYRFYLFGIVVAVSALFALGSLLTVSEARTVAWPGIAVTVIGLMVGACADAFYYHFGAWGALYMDGKSPAEIETFVDSLLISTEYVTCLVRFGRVFGGFGLLVLGVGLWKWKVLPSWAGGVAVLMGVAAMAVTMGLPDDLHLYAPIWHLFAVWLVGVGATILRLGVRTN
jgi:hypothetical protein